MHMFDKNENSMKVDRTSGDMKGAAMSNIKTNRNCQKDV